MKRMRGVASVEFYIVTLFVMLPLVLGILQLGMLYVAKNTLNHATFLAARAGALDHGHRATMFQHLAKGLVPLYARTSQRIDSSNVARVVGPAYLQAFADVRNPLRTRLRILNPSASSFRDFERDQDGVRQIPNDNLQFRTETGASSRQTIQEANILKIRVDYCQRLIFPFVDRIITSIGRLSTTSAFSQLCYNDNRVPISARAILHMQSAPRRSAMGL
jgi:hypothetical protein